MSDQYLQVHTYNGGRFSANNLSVESLSGLLRDLGENHLPYCRFYSGGRLIREASFADLCRYSRALASFFQSSWGLAKGDKVVVKLGNSDFTLIAYCALLYMGAVIVPVDPADIDYNIEYIMEDSGAKGIVSVRDEPGFKAKGLFTLRFDDDFFRELTERREAESVPGGDADDTALIIYTSGTTGRPKGVRLTQGNLLINAEAKKRIHGMDESSVHMCVLPLFHVNAFCFSFVTTLYCRCRLVLNRGFYLPDFWRIIENEKVQVVSVVPAIIRMLCDDRRKIEAGGMPSTLKYFISAAAPLSKALANRFYERFGLRINQGYGLSEAVNFSLTVPPDLWDSDYREIFLDQDIPSAGTPLFGNHVEIMDREGNILGPEQEGEIVIRGWNLMQGYLNREKEIEEAFRFGWFHTGDLGFFKEHGGQKYFFVNGRIKEIAIRNGENISLPYLDLEVQKIKGLEQCVAVGFENIHVDEEIGLFVVKNEHTPDEEGILAACAEALGRAHAPKVVVFGDRLPRTLTGKLKRNHLKERFADFKERNYA